VLRESETGLCDRWQPEKRVGARLYWVHVWARTVWRDLGVSEYYDMRYGYSTAWAAGEKARMKD